MGATSKFHLTRTLAFLAICAVFAEPGHAADPDKKDPSSPAAERLADAGQPGDTTAKPPAKQPSQAPMAREFEPPPVPEFMLKKPAKPLTMEEMKRQADEAAERARRARAAGKTGSPGAAPDTGSTGETSPQLKM